MRGLRRNTALLVAVVGMAGAVISSQAQNSRSSTLVYGGDWTDLNTVDPGQSYEFTGSIVTDNLYETLVKFEGDDLSTLKPGLATSWTITDAGDSWKVTFKLRPNAKFASGRPVTAADAVYTFDRAISLKGNGSFLFTDVANIKVGSTRAVNPSTLEVTLPKTASPQGFLNLLTFNIGGIVDSTEVKAHIVNNDFGTGWLKTNSAGSGPFVLRQWDQGQQVVLDANPNSRLLPKLNRVVLRFAKEANAQKIALESGEIDIAEGLTPEMARDKAKDSKYTVYKADLLNIYYLGMNSSKDSIFGDTRIRQAVRWAIDQDSIVANLLGANTATPYKVDVEKAKALLAAAGKPNGFEFEFLVPQYDCGGVACTDVAVKIQADLAAIGLKANIKVVSVGELLTAYRAQKIQMVLILWGPDFPDPDGNATALSDYSAKSVAWRNSWNNDQATKLAEQAKLEPNPQKRAALYKQLTELHLQDGWGAMLYQGLRNVVMQKNVQGYVRNPQGTIRLEKISKQ
jgi:peptide/nickel transport system substrate-binding protein